MMNKLLKQIWGIILGILGFILILHDRTLLWLSIVYEVPSLKEYTRYPYLLEDALDRFIVAFVIYMITAAIWINLYHIALIKLIYF